MQFRESHLLGRHAHLVFRRADMQIIECGLFDPHIRWQGRIYELFEQKDNLLERIRYAPHIDMEINQRHGPGQNAARWLPASSRSRKPPVSPDR